MEKRRLTDFRLRLVFSNNNELFDAIEAASSSVSSQWLEFALIDRIEGRSLAQRDFCRGVDVNVE